MKCPSREILQACMGHHAARRPTNGSWASLRGDRERERGSFSEIQDYSVSGSLVTRSGRTCHLARWSGDDEAKEGGGGVVSVLCPRFYVCLCQISILLVSYSSACVLRTCINLIPLNGELYVRIRVGCFEMKPYCFILYSLFLSLHLLQIIFILIDN